MCSCPDSSLEEARSRGQDYLERMFGPGARFRSGQWEAIERVLSGRSPSEGARLLLVQRTGWGKSLIYFLATRLLRDRGAGPTLLISPLLALMRNQIAMAERLGIRAVTINSANFEEWETVEAELRADKVDVLIVSPERLANGRFAKRVLSGLGGSIGLFVVDEAHCISDWGHDFRPDYRRIVEILKRLPRKAPILATTATANERVVADILAQIGERMEAIRGPLARSSLRLDALQMPGQDERMGWLAENVPRLVGSGIIYCLTVPDVSRVARFLVQKGVNVLPYCAALSNDQRLYAEEALRKNEVKALVASVALGMGYDKPDLGFVIHFQSPGSLVGYYQQVGRAGRALPDAAGMMLLGAEDEEIHEYFMRTAFPRQTDMEAILGAFREADEPLTRKMLGGRINVPANRIEQCLKILEIEGVIARPGGGGPCYFLTGAPWRPDAAGEERVTELRCRERNRVLAYAQTGDCLMRFLVRELDAVMDEPCGRCRNCVGALFSGQVKNRFRKAARNFLRNQAEPIPVKNRWPASLDGTVKPIPETERACEGRALSLYGDAGFGERVARGKYGEGRFDDDLVRGAAEFIRRRWNPFPFPTWIASVPSLERAELVRDFAERLAARLRLPFVEAVEKIRPNEPQKEMESAYHQAANVWRAFEVRGKIPDGPVFLVDDITDSGWTLTCIAIKLRQAGSGPVFPFALATAGARRDTTHRS